MYFYKYIISYYVMVNDQVLITNKPQVKIISGQKSVAMPTCDHNILI